MHVLQVFIHINPEFRDAFITITRENARASREEPGVARFDFYAQQDDPSRFVLIEVYRNAEAPAKHKETSHYRKWAELVQDMLAEPRQRNLLTNLYPEDEGF